ncbi:MAG TPA: DUF885 family protein, partial [Gemmatimonadales bacterium]
MKVGRLLAVLALSSAGCARHPGPEVWDAKVQQFLTDYFKANPTFAVFSGKHEYDGTFPDWSATGIQKEVYRLHTWQDSVVAFDTANLDATRTFQRGYVLAVIDKDLFWLEEARSPFTNPAYYNDALDPNVYITRPYAPLPDRMKSFATWARNIPAALKQIRGTLKTPMPKVYVERGKLLAGGLASYLENDVPQVFASITDKSTKAPFDSARLAAAKAFHAMDAWFDTLKATAIDSFALGPAVYKKMLWMTERVDVPLDTLEMIGRADLNRNLAALHDACATYAPGQTLGQCMAKMSAHKPPGNTVEAALAQLAGLLQYILDKDLVTIPGTEQANVMESPPYQRWNFAYIDIPGPYEKNLPSVYYVAPPDPK